MVGAAAASTLSAVGTVAGIASSAIGVMQGMQQAQFAQQQAQLQIRQQQQQAELSNQQAANQYVGEVASQQAQELAYNQQLVNNQTAANKSFVQEQTKLNEARQKAAFRSQEIYAKQIGAKGAVLATGATGQSVGLLALDADRQAGLQQAQQDASISSAAQQASVAGDLAFTQAESADNQAYSQLRIPVQAPTLAPSPGGGPIDAPTYNWFE
tara:strand:- start:70 stop:705 length:636 start_codon:yes stop_codon:yes gene_type:complete